MPERAVDRAAEQQALQQALIAEQIDQRDRRQQRRREQRQHRRRIEQPFERHSAAGQRIGIDEGERDHDRGRDDRDPDAVEDRAEQCRRREIADVVREPDEFAVLVLEALRQQRPERQRDRQQQPGDQQNDADRAAPRPRARRARAGGADGQWRSTLKAPLPSVLGENSRSDFRRQRDGELLALGRPQDRASGWPRNRRGWRPRAPPRARACARQNEPRKSSIATRVAIWFCVAASILRTRISSGRNPIRTAVPRMNRLASPQASSSAAELAALSGPGDLGVEERHGADEVGDEGASPACGRSRTACRPARSRPGSSPRCGRPSPALLPGRASP